MRTPLLDICLTDFPSVIEHMILSTAEEGLLFFPENCADKGLMVGFGVGIDIGCNVMGMTAGVDTLSGGANNASDKPFERTGGFAAPGIRMLGSIGFRIGANSFNSGTAPISNRLYFLDVGKADAGDDGPDVEMGPVESFRVVFARDCAFPPILADLDTAANCPNSYTEKEGRVVVVSMRREVPASISPVPNMAAVFDNGVGLAGHVIIAF